MLVATKPIGQTGAEATEGTSAVVADSQSAKGDEFPPEGAKSVEQKPIADVATEIPISVETPTSTAEEAEVAAAVAVAVDDEWMDVSAEPVPDGAAGVDEETTPSHAEALGEVELLPEGATSVSAVEEPTAGAVIGVPASIEPQTPELDGEVKVEVPVASSDGSPDVIEESKTDVGVGVDGGIGSLNAKEDTPVADILGGMKVADGVVPARKCGEESGLDGDLEPAPGLAVKAAPEPALESKSGLVPKAEKVSNRAVDAVAGRVLGVVTEKMAPVDGSLFATVDVRALADAVGMGYGSEDGAAVITGRPLDAASVADSSTEDGAEPSKRFDGPVAMLRRKFEQLSSSEERKNHENLTDTAIKLPAPVVEEKAVSDKGKRRPAPVQEVPNTTFERKEDNDIANGSAPTKVKEKTPAVVVEKPARATARKARTRRGEGGFVAAAVKRLSSQSRQDEQFLDDSDRQHPHDESIPAGARNDVAHGGEGAFVVASIGGISSPRLRDRGHSRDNTGRPLFYHGISRYLDSELVFTSPSDIDTREVKETLDIAAAVGRSPTLVTAAAENLTTRQGPSSAAMTTQGASVEGSAEHVGDGDEGDTPGKLSAAAVEAEWVTENEESGFVVSSGSLSECCGVRAVIGDEDDDSLVDMGRGECRMGSDRGPPYGRDSEDDLPEVVCPTPSFCIIS